MFYHCYYHIGFSDAFKATGSGDPNEKVPTINSKPTRFVKVSCREVLFLIQD